MINAPKGTIDVTPEEVYKWQYIEKKLREIADLSNFKELRTPVFEHTELFARGVGDTSDIVNKEMYTFEDKGGRSITLRPEGTAGVVRSFIEKGMYAKTLPAKLFYIISCYRYEKPQAGRLREFRQFGIELFGAEKPSADAEIISLADSVFKSFGVENISLNLNNIGCPECRRAYNEKLKEYMQNKKDKLCDTCRERLDKNPMRIFDCKSEICASLLSDAPRIYDCVCDDCKNHFEKLLSYLDEAGIKYNIDKNIVRGLDYYTKTVFEFVSSNIGAQGTVLGGGRYDNLVEEIGGKKCCGIGFAMGLERFLLLLESAGVKIEDNQAPDLYIVSFDGESDIKASSLINDMRKSGIKCDKDLCGRSFNAQMKYANKINAKYLLVLGEDEIKTGNYQLKNMITGEKAVYTADELLNKGWLK